MSPDFRYAEFHGQTPIGGNGLVDVEAQAEQIRSFVAALGLSVDPRGRLAVYFSLLAQARSASNRRTPLTPEQLAALLRAVLEINQFATIARAFAPHVNDPYVRRKVLEALGGPPLPEDSGTETLARDIQFELFLVASAREAGMLAQLISAPDASVAVPRLHFPVTNPIPQLSGDASHNVVFNVEPLFCGFAAKRLKSHRQLEKRARRANQQIRETMAPGVFVTDVSDIICPPGHVLTPPASWLPDTYVIAKLDSYVTANREAVRRRVNTEHTFAWLACAHVLVVPSEQSVPIHYLRWQGTWLSSANDPRYQSFAVLVARLGTSGPLDVAFDPAQWT